MIHTIASIQTAVAREHKIPVAEIIGRNRCREFVEPRHEAMWICRQIITQGWNHRPISLPAIGRRFGNRDHTTVLSALRAVDKRRESDPLLRIKMRRMIIAARSMGL